MLKGIVAAGTLALMAATGARAANDGVIDINQGETLFKGFFDVGQIVHGFNEETGRDYKMQTLRRANVLVTRGGKLSDHLETKMGLMGVFFYVLPEQDGAPHTRLPKFAVVPVSAALVGHFGGETASPLVDMELGIFQYKYNPDASNLGEYLLRSGTYPGYLVTGGFNIINSASAQVQGAAIHFNLMENRWKTSFLLPMESAMPPMHSISPTLVSTIKLPGVELGAGVSFNHLISAKPSKEKPNPHDPSTTPDYMDWPTSIIKEVKKIKVPDASAPGGTRDSVVVIRDTTDFYTFQGTKLMGRITVDPKEWIGGSEIMHPADLRLFAEAAVLGVQNYPFYYPDISRRIPIMFGMNVPTFGLLDLLSVQGEYYNSLWANNIDGVFEFQRPVPYHPDYDPANGPETTADRARRDAWHWSVLARRDLVKGASLFLQVANDHMRTFDYNIKPIKIPVTSRPSDFYYLFRIDVAI